MSKNLTAQQLADELGVTRQLIYYHAKNYLRIVKLMMMITH